jgi:3-oxoadipate enol-lactonase
MFARTKDDAEIYYEVHDFTEPWRSSESLLLHHGLRSNYRTWYAWIPLLATKYRVITLDARGRGESTIPPPGFQWSLDQFATDALAVMDAVGEERVHWLGTSFGSVVGQYVAATYGERMKTLSLLSPPYRFTHLKEVIDGWIAQYDELGPNEFLRHDVRKMFPEDTDPAILEWHAEQMNTMPVYVAKDLLGFLSNVNLANLLPKISVPTLIMAAAKSDRAPSTEADFMMQEIPDCEVVVFDSHHNIAATATDQCATALLEFLERQEKRS